MNHAIFSTRMTPRLLVMALALAMIACTAVPAMAQGRGRRGDNSERELRQLLTPVVADTRQSVVTLLADGETVGLATVVDARGYLIAKASDLRAAEELVIRVDEDNEFVARVAGRDRANDLVLLHIAADGLVPVRLAETEAAAIGEWVITVGPEAEPRRVGIVSAEPRPIAPRRLVLGVMLAPDGEGLVVTNLTEGYGAARAGVEVGDIITHVMGKKVIAIQQVVAALQDGAMGDSVAVALIRAGEAIEMEIEIEEMQPDPTSRGERMNRMGGEVSDRSVGFEMVLQHDAELRPADCGGPLVNLDGEVVGINIARAGRIATYALPSGLVAEVVAELIQQDQEPAGAAPIEGQ